MAVNFLFFHTVHCNCWIIYFHEFYRQPTKYKYFQKGLGNFELGVMYCLKRIYMAPKYWFEMHSAQN